MTNLVHLYGFYEWWCIAHVLPYCLYAFESINVGDTAFPISICYLHIYAHLGKGLPTYCISRIVGRQPFAANYFKT